MSDKKRVTGIGGIFFKSNDPDYMRIWYQKHLGLDNSPYGSVFEWRDINNPDKKGSTIWSAFRNSTDYFQPSEREFMINFRVEDLEWLLAELKKEGIEQVGEMQVHDYGKFAHIIDPEGIKIELREASDEDAGQD